MLSTYSALGAWNGDPALARPCAGWDFGDLLGHLTVQQRGLHARDIAVSAGATLHLHEDVLTAALAITRRVPDGAERDKPGAAVAHALAVEPGAGLLDEILLLLGRDPAGRADPLRAAPVRNAVRRAAARPGG